MAVRVAHENLPSAVRPHFALTKSGLHLLEMRFPFVEVIHAERVMVAAIVGMHCLGAVTDDVQFLARAESKPRPGEGESWTRHGFKSQHDFIELTTGLDILHVNGYMIEFPYLHAPGIKNLDAVDEF